MSFTFELVTPERQLLAGEAEQVVVPGTEGDFAVLAGHTPLVSTLRPGILDITMTNGRKRMFVKKGVAEADPQRLTVLAQSAISVDDMTPAMIDAELKAAEAERTAANDDATRLAADTLIDILHRLRG
jgi:F-type H+-transporting ATPase subunit epsilon